MANQNLTDRLNAGVAAVVVPGTSDGLVSKNGVPGNTTGSAITAGYIGEVKIVKTASPVTVSSATQANPIFGNVTLQPGVYAPYIAMRVVTTGTVTINEQLIYGFSTDSGSATWTDLDANGQSNSCGASVVLGGSTLTATQVRFFASAAFPPIVVSAATTYYFKSANRVTSGSLDHTGFLTFTRIA